MPTFSIQQPRGIADSIRMMLSSSPDPSAAQYAQADNIVAQGQAHTAAAEHARMQAEQIRQNMAQQTSDRAFRNDPANAINYASQGSGVNLADANRIEGARTGVMEQPSPADQEDAAAAGGQAQPFPTQPPNVPPELANVFRSLLASTGATRMATAPTNAEQMVKAGGELQGQGITGAVQQAIAKGDMQNASAMNQGGKPGTAVKLFDNIGNTGATFAPATGAVQTNPAAVAALKAAQPANLQHITDPMGKLLAFDPRTGTAAPIKTPEGGVVGELSPGAAAAATVSGPEFLTSLAKPMADQIKALAEGRMQFPAGFALKSPYWQDMISKVSQYDPSFDAVNYNARSKTRGDFTSGKSATSLNAINTVMGHLDDLEKAGTALNNTDYPLLNKAVNFVGANVSPDLKGRLNAYNLTRQAVASEMERAYRGGSGDLESLKAWKQTLDDADSPEAIRKSIVQAVKLLSSKMDALGEQYNKGMGTTKEGIQLLTPKAQNSYARLVGGEPAQVSAGQINATPAAAPAAAAAMPSKPNNARPAMPKEGMSGMSKSGRPMIFQGGSWAYSDGSGA